MQMLRLMQETPWFVHAARDFLLISVGFTFEVLFTAVYDFKKSGNLRLKGFTYIWMLPIYAVVYPALLWLYPHTMKHHWAARGFFYVAIIYVIEYTSGWALRKVVGECPWEAEYRGHKWAVHDLIRLDFFPAWLVAALLFESFFRVLTLQY